MVEVIALDLVTEDRLVPLTDVIGATLETRNAAEDVALVVLLEGVEDVLEGRGVVEGVVLDVFTVVVVRALVVVLLLSDELEAFVVLDDVVDTARRRGALTVVVIVRGPNFCRQ